MWTQVPFKARSWLYYNFLGQGSLLGAVEDSKSSGATPYVQQSCQTGLACEIDTINHGLAKTDTSSVKGLNERLTKHVW